MDSDLAQEAINAALNGKWNQAIEFNSRLLTSNPGDIDSLNRLARAYAETGDLKKAKITCQKVLKLDTFNTIARHALEKWKTLRKSSGTLGSRLAETYSAPPSGPQTFLEEPGKTKIVSLLFLGGPKILAKLDAADEVKLDSHSHRVIITTTDGKYVGRLSDDLSARLKRLIKFGNEYQAYIKSVMPNEVKVLIREVKRSKKISDVQSFPIEKIDYVSFTPPELVHKKDELMVEEEVDEGM
jgi:tetratricopeptide (TPR) repeat protein